MCTFVILLCLSTPAVASVLPGIDTLQLRHFDALQGKRVGLVTNHTGRSANGQSTIDILFTAPGVRLVALFSPEHGIRGNEDAKVPSGIDSRTGLPVNSLYGISCRPTSQMLKGIDLLVIDLQNVGSRFYTYIGTVSLVMRAAQSNGIPVVVLDRPNPINGVAMGGAIPVVPVPEKSSGCGALTSIHPIPTRHGMTIGELARLFNGEFGIGCNLTVIPMQGWQRALYYDETALPWSNPSPNMRSMTAALLYPGFGILESTNLSVGRGTDRPFELYGAPWFDGNGVATLMQKRTLPGVRFTAVSFVPSQAGQPYTGKACSGIGVTITDRRLFDPVLAGLSLLQAIYQLHPSRFKTVDGFGTEVGDRGVWSQLTTGGQRPEEVIARWQVGLDRFAVVRNKYLLY